MKAFLVLMLVVAVAPVQARDDRSAAAAVPDVSVNAEPEVVPQGGIITVRVRALDAPVREVTAEFGRARAQGFSWENGDVVVLLPVRIEERIGPAAISLSVVDGWGKRTVLQVPIRISAGDFETCLLYTSPSPRD